MSISGSHFHMATAILQRLAKPLPVHLCRRNVLSFRAAGVCQSGCMAHPVPTFLYMCLLFFFFLLPICPCHFQSRAGHHNLPIWFSPYWLHFLKLTPILATMKKKMFADTNCRIVQSLCQTWTTFLKIWLNIPYFVHNNFTFGLCGEIGNMSTSSFHFHVAPQVHEWAEKSLSKWVTH